MKKTNKAQIGAPARFDKQAWHCEECKCSGDLTYDQHVEAYEVLEKIRRVHQRMARKCTGEPRVSSVTTVTGVECPNCHVIIYSRAQHDFHSCKCGQVSVDGGFDYLRICFKDKFPKRKKLDVFASKDELYQDWNKATNRFGWIFSTPKKK